MSFRCTGKGILLGLLTFSADAQVAQFYDHGNPTAYEQLMLEMVNRARANPGAEAARLGIDLNEGLAPGTIANTPKQPLALHPQLIAAARAHSQWMLDTDVFAHEGAGGSTPGDRMGNAGYAFTGSWTWGENISWTGSTGPIDFNRMTMESHDGLFRSPGHRVNIANNTFDEIGVGVLGGTFTNAQRDWNAVMSTQNFARSGSTPAPLLLGIVFQDADEDSFYDPGEGVAGVTVQLSGSNWYTVTSDSGGYALPYPAGSGILDVFFSGATLTAHQIVSVAKTGSNLKVDLDLSEISNLPQWIEGSLTMTAAGRFQAEVSGAPGTSFSLQHSTDLVGWTTVSTYTMEGDGSMGVTHAPSSPETPHFYRLHH